MRRVRKVLVGLLAAVCVVISTSGNVPVAGGTPPHTTAQSAPESASDERQEGRNFLRVGKAAEALIHLERARRAFHDSGDVSGEASPLVMLSACETGLGRERRGEVVMGLTRAFMYAGAPTVGVTLWSVADKSTSELMADFYKNLLGGSTPAPSDAMRRARLRMIAGGRFSAPYYWAPFVLVGDWR